MRWSLILLLVGLIASAALLQAQSTGSESRGDAARPLSNGKGVRAVPSHNPSRPHHPRGYGNGAISLPYSGYWVDPLSPDYALWDYVNFPPSEGEPQGPSELQTDRQPSAPESAQRPRGSASAVEPPKVIEVPTTEKASALKPQPPAVFVLTNGERIESRHYLLTDEFLSIEIGRSQRTIKISALDLDATMAANQERGTELVIPRGSNSVFLGF